MQLIDHAAAAMRVGAALLWQLVRVSASLLHSFGVQLSKTAFEHLECFESLCEIH